MSIPPVSDPSGVGFDQPDGIGSAPMDEEVVSLSAEQFAALLDATDPFLSDEVFEGKCWKFGRLGRWYLGWYSASEHPAFCHTNTRLIEIVR